MIEPSSLAPRTPRTSALSPGVPTLRSFSAQASFSAPLGASHTYRSLPSSCSAASSPSVDSGVRRFGLVKNTFVPSLLAVWNSSSASASGSLTPWALSSWTVSPVVVSRMYRRGSGSTSPFVGAAPFQMTREPSLETAFLTFLENWEPSAGSAAGSHDDPLHEACEGGGSTLTRRSGLLPLHSYRPACSSGSGSTDVNVALEPKTT